MADFRLTQPLEKLLRLLASQPMGRIDCYAKELDEFSDDNSTLTKPDVLNRAFDLDWAKQRYDNSHDTGTVEITEKGRAVLDDT